MLALTRLAWRNLWRNTRRTLITVTTLTLGVTAIVALTSYNRATFEQMIRSVTSGLVGHLQVTGRGYHESPELGTVVDSPAQVEAVIAGVLAGARVERRVLGAGLAGTGESSSPVMLLGVDPRSESRLRRIVAGADLGGEPLRQAVLGKGLAEALGIGVGGELVAVSQAADGSVANDRFSVVGIARTDSAELDQRAVFLHVADAQGFFGLGDGVHQLVVRLPEGAEDLGAPLAALRGALDLATVDAAAWSEILPELERTVAEKKKGLRIVDLVVFLIVALGVLNATSMSTFERTRELGVMAALGTRPSRILGLVMTEALLQGLVSLALGVLLAAAILHSIGTVDLTQLTDQDVMGVRMPEAVRLELRAEAVGGAAVTAALTVLAGCLLPALRAARLSPAEAARHV